MLLNHASNLFVHNKWTGWSIYLFTINRPGWSIYLFTINGPVGQILFRFLKVVEEIECVYEVIFDEITVHRLSADGYDVVIGLYFPGVCEDKYVLYDEIVD